MADLKREKETIINNRKFFTRYINVVGGSSDIPPHLNKAIFSLDSSGVDITGVRTDTSLFGGYVKKNTNNTWYFPATITLSGAWEGNAYIDMYSSSSYGRLGAFFMSDGTNSVKLYSRNSQIYFTVAGTLCYTSAVTTNKWYNIPFGVDSDYYVFVTVDGVTYKSATTLDSSYSITNTSNPYSGVDNMHLGSFNIDDQLSVIFESGKGWDISGNGNHSTTSLSTLQGRALQIDSVLNIYGYNEDSTITPADPNNPTLDLDGNTLVDYVGKNTFNPTIVSEGVYNFGQISNIYNQDIKFDTQLFYNDETALDYTPADNTGNYEDKDILFTKSDGSCATMYNESLLTESEKTDIKTYFEI